MKTKLLFTFFSLIILGLSAQTTHNLDWYAGIGNSVDLTIETGDTVIWTWTSPNHTVENDPSGSSVETFNSGFLGPTGSTFSYTFTVVGTNDYYCGVHGSASMSGTITVTTLSTDDFSKKEFSIYPNPSSDKFTLELPTQQQGLLMEVYDVLGKKIVSKKLDGFNSNPVINVTGWNKGVYLVKLSSEHAVQTKKFIKQ